MPENELQHEASPYLLHHKDNPVHWVAWGGAAFARAKADNKPILLSVGYAACHWCHVMAHKSFEDEEICAVMNDLVINIKVDPEERPDIDTIYQSAFAMVGEQGGWPLTMFWTPYGEPFWDGTYFPPTPRYSRPGFPDVVKAVAETFKADPDRIQKNVEALRKCLADNIVRTFAGEPTRNFLPPLDIDQFKRIASTQATNCHYRRPRRCGDPGAGRLRPQPFFAGPDIKRRRHTG